MKTPIGSQQSNFKNAPITTEYVQFTDFLKTELAERCRKNPKYSLRAFSQSLGLTSSFLSKLLNGQRPLTEKTLKQISEKLGLSPDQVEFYQRSSKSLVLENLTMAYRQLNQDQFQFIADWYHFAILELVSLENFDSSSTGIARSLGINVNEAKAAVERLVRMGLLKKNKQGNLINVSGNNTTIGKEIAISANQNQQKQILEMAITALYEVPIEQRSQTSMTMAIPSSRVHEAKKMITEFRRNMTALLQRKGERDSVHQLAISFYPVTKNLNNQQKLGTALTPKAGLKKGEKK